MNPQDIIIVCIIAVLCLALGSLSKPKKSGHIEPLKPWPNPPPHYETEFDIEGQPVFSIERDDGRTCLGIWSEKISDKVGHGKPVSWYLDISAEEHNALAHRFRKKLSRENSVPSVPVA